MQGRKSAYHAVVGSAVLVMMLAFGVNTLAADQNPCAEDMAKFCKDVKPGTPLLQCLEEHENQLSEPCKAYEAQMERPRGESREVVRQQMRIRQACLGDIEKFCNEPKPGGSITACLGGHMSDLSGPCGDALKAAKGHAE
jgi:hypothetical protein